MVEAIGHFLCDRGYRLGFLMDQRCESSDPCRRLNFYFFGNKGFLGNCIAIDIGRDGVIKEIRLLMSKDIGLGWSKNAISVMGGLRLSSLCITDLLTILDNSGLLSLDNSGRPALHHSVELSRILAQCA
ncbi:MAG: hypothetical protein JW946_03355 [Candidatus Omnitrophica bacterium]|nr:hypothetical protein [Candidatus Omnitrophota bacterium]